MGEGVGHVVRGGGCVGGGTGRGLRTKPGLHFESYNGWEVLVQKRFKPWVKFLLCQYGDIETDGHFSFLTQGFGGRCCRK